MIYINISRKDLEDAGACGAGLDFFDRIVAMSGDDSGHVAIEWSPLCDVWISVSAGSFASWLREKKLIPIANLRGADLGGASLRWANLCGANLCGASLRWANLCGANLCGALRYSDDADTPGWKLQNGILIKA